MKKFRKRIILSLFILSAICLMIGVGYLVTTTSEAILDETKLPSEQTASCVFDISGNPISHNNYVKISDISESIQNAFVAVEDKRFYSHSGIDPIRILGATINNVKNGSFTQGASTITCQLIKNTQLNGEKTLKRKWKEAIIANKLEKKYSKKQILEMYLNVIYFGKGVYGIRDASIAIFGKEPSEINASEAAVLAATVKCPLEYSPLINPLNNRERAKIVFDLMKNQGFLNANSKFEAPNIIINYSESHNNIYNNYINSVLFEAKSILKTQQKAITERGYKIYTFFDSNAQSIVESALSQELDAVCIDGSDVQKEFILSDNKTRGVIAYASTIKDGNPFSVLRQPGSTIKPFIYAAAIQSGKLLPETPVLDEKTVFGNYTPKNYADTYRGWIDAEIALSESSNIVAVKILQALGPVNASNFLTKCGISLSKDDENLALALGGTTHGSSIAELCEAYQTFANEGRRKPLSFVRKITDKYGKIIYTDHSLPEEVMQDTVAYLTTKMLKNAVKEGTASQLGYLGIDVAAKTGTVAKNSGNGDAWIAGYTSEHTFVCRYGSPIGKTMHNNVTGGNQPAKTARFVLRELYTKKPSVSQKPIGISSIEINSFAKMRDHTLVRYDDLPFGGRETIEIWDQYEFQTPNYDTFFLGDLSIETTNGIRICFKEIPNVSYGVLMNGKPGKGSNGSYYFDKKRRFGLTKLSIVCSSGGTELYRKEKWIII